MPGRGCWLRHWLVQVWRFCVGQWDARGRGVAGSVSNFGQQNNVGRLIVQQTNKICVLYFNSVGSWCLNHCPKKRCQSTQPQAAAPAPLLWELFRHNHVGLEGPPPDNPPLATRIWSGSQNQLLNPCPIGANQLSECRISPWQDRMVQDAVHTHIHT